MLRELEGSGHSVRGQADASLAHILAQQGQFDVLILAVDLSPELSRRDGVQFLADLRRRGCAVPILAICDDDARTMLASLDCGADEFIVAPLRLGELQARLEAALRGARSHANAVVSHGDIRLDRAAQLVMLAGQPIPLQAREFMLLQHLLEHRGRVHSRAKLQESLYAQESDIDSNAIEVHVHNLRRKLGKDLIRTVHGQGYVIDGVS